MRDEGDDAVPELAPAPDLDPSEWVPDDALTRHDPAPLGELDGIPELLVEDVQGEDETPTTEFPIPPAARPSTPVHGLNFMDFYEQGLLDAAPRNQRIGEERVFEGLRKGLFAGGSSLAAIAEIERKLRDWCGIRGH